MADPRVANLARVIVDYSIAVKPGDTVAIQSSTLAEPLLKELYARILQAGGHPWMMTGLPGLDELFYKYASDEQIQFIHKPHAIISETYDCRISLIAESNTKALSGVSPEKTVLRQKATAPLLKTMLKRSAAKDFRWTVAPFPTNALAQDADMSLSDYEDFVYSACVPDMNDPVGYWQRFSKNQQRIVDWLNTKKDVHVVGPDTDLRLSIAGRHWENCDGHYNMPDGEVFTGPVEDSIEGHVYFSYPAIEMGREVTGIHLWFEKGRVVKATAEKNEEFLLQTIATDEGSHYVGEFAIGTNEGITQFTREILFDEKINGSFHMALGAGYPETGSHNDSGIHWDMVCDLRNGGEITMDGELMYKNGKFII